jgi:hypothetical protein
MNCPECGAPDGACETRFHEFLAKEFTDPGYGAVHHLMVTAFMLQHSGKMSREGWLYQRDLLRDFLVNGKTPDVVRKQNRGAVDSRNRKFNINSSDGRPLFDKSTWRKSIMDVDAGDAQKYCRDIAIWAKAVLDDAEKLVPEAK